MATLFSQAVHRALNKQNVTMKSKTGERIRMFRVVQRFTQEELAGRLGWSQSKICRYEKGDGVPDSEELPKLARALRCLVTDLLPDEPDAPFQITIRPA